jgi:8-oxo-dGTP diphosphatase
MPPLIVTAAILRNGSDVLITRRPDGSRHAGCWEFPGGKLQEDESPQEAIAREVLEELDLMVSVGDIFEVAYYNYGWGAVLLLAYECQSRGGEIRNLEVAEHRWVAPADLDRYDILPADRPIIERLQSPSPSRPCP